MENKNQWDENVLFKADVGGGSVFLEKYCFTYVFEDVDAVKELMSYKFLDPEAKKNKELPSNSVNYHAYKVYFDGPVKEAIVTSEVPSSEYYNYFIGNDPSRWASKIRKYRDVTYSGIYENIDLKVYERDFHLKYDYIVHPGANPDDIQLLYEGTDGLSVKENNLVIKTSVNNVMELKPYAYQEINGEKKEITCRFKLHKNKVSFVLPDGYDASVDLIIDPILIFSSYSGSTADNWGYSATYDSDGFLFTAGNVFNFGFPTTVGAFQTTFGGGNCDIALSKYDTTGHFLIYSTYLGGSGPEVPNSTIVNSNDELFVLGTSGSSDFPTTTGAYDTSFNGGVNYTLTYVLNYTLGSDITIAHFSADGTQLMGSTYFGGTGNDGLNGSTVLRHNYADDVRGEIMIDINDNIYVVSSTTSTDFPVTAGSFQTAYGGGLQDGCILKIDNNLSNIIWSSYIGGSGDDAVYAVSIDGNQDMYVCGGTTSADFPVTAGTLQQNFMGGSCDGYITKINQNGNAIVRSTYYGSTAYDQTYLLELDKQDNVYVVGQTEAAGNTWIYNALWNTPNSGQFISKIDPMLFTLDWSTAFGTGNGIPNISPTAFLVDLCGNIYMSGWGGSVNGFGGTSGLPVSPDAFQLTTDNSDYYFLCIKDDASALVYATFFGGTAYEHVDGGTSRFDKSGKIYQAVCAGCGGNQTFPTTTGAWSNSNNSSNCNNGVIKFDFKLPLVIADFDPPPVGCTAYNAFFLNTSHTSGTSGISYDWDFGDGGSSTAVNPTHNYPQSGIYNVTLIVSDTGSCNLADTVTHQVVVLDNTTDTLAEVTMCSADFVQIGLLPLPDTSLTYQWIPAAFLSNDTISNPIASPPATATYILLISNGICTDSIFQTVNVTILTVDAGPDTTICSGNALLSASSTGGANEFIWSTTSNFADTLNSPLSNNNVTVNPDLETTYYVHASNQLCSRVDSVTVHISEVNMLAAVDHGICEGDTTTINVANLNPSNPLTYVWSPSGSIVSGTSASTAFVNPSVTTDFIVVATDTMGCTRTDTVTITVSNISANVITDSVLCYGDCNGWAAIFPLGGVPPFNYLWSTGSVQDSITDLCADNYFVIITDSFACQRNYSFDIISPTMLSISIADTEMVDCDSVCDGYATILVGGGTPSYQYLWVDGQTTVTADSLCAGNYSVTVTDHNGCEIILPVEITDTSNFDALIDSITEPLCFGYCDGLAFSSAYGGQIPYSFNWDTGDTLYYTDSLCAGTHNVLIYENGGCIRNLFFNVQQPTAVIADSLNATQPSCTDICDGQLTVGGSGGTPSYTYLWSGGQTTAGISGLCEGDYFVTVYDSHLCPGLDTMTLVDPSPLLLSTASTNVPCVEVCNGVATASSSGSTPPYSYEWSNGYTGNPAINLCPGTYYVTVTDAHFCIAVDTIVVHDSTTFPPNIYTYADDTLIYNTQSTGLHTTVIPGFTYSWTPSESLDNPTSPNPIATPNYTTTYIVVIEDQYGCTYIDTVIVIVVDVLCDESQIYVPNAFTPNGDNNNDVFYVRSNIMNEIYLAIYDRWGEKVFETTDMNQGWNGTFRSMDCDPGVFDYYLKVTCINDMEFVKKGNITLIR